MVVQGCDTVPAQPIQPCRSKKCHHISEVQELLDGRLRGNTTREHHTEQERDDATSGTRGSLSLFLEEIIEHHISVIIFLEYHAIFDVIFSNFQYIIDFLG